MRRRIRPLLATLALCTLLALGACGGGGSRADADSAKFGELVWGSGRWQDRP